MQPINTLDNQLLFSRKKMANQRVAPYLIIFLYMRSEYSGMVKNPVREILRIYLQINQIINPGSVDLLRDCQTRF